MQNKLKQEIKTTEALIELHKKEFAKYISDNSYPLGIRWDFFCEAPTFIKNQDDYIHTFNWEKKHGELVWYDDFYCDRYQVVGMDTIIESMEDRDEKYTKEMIIDMKEEILSKNLGSFINDW